MNPKTYRILEQLNNLLIINNNKIQITDLKSDYLKFSNGLELHGISEVTKCKRRINLKFFSDKIDLFYSINEKDLIIAKKLFKLYKSGLGKIGATLVQEKYGKNYLLNATKIWRERTGYSTKGISTNLSPWNKNITKSDDSRLMKISIDRTGEGNPMYGKIHSEEYKLESSRRMKIKILNGSFTPNANNRRTHFGSRYNGKKYRSSWEAAFHSIHPTYEYESLRIEYKNSDNFNKIYIVDFVNHVDKIVVEIKPKSIIKRCRNSDLKIKALQKWAYDNQYQMILYDEDMLYNDRKRIVFDNIDNDSVKKIQMVIKKHEIKKNSLDR